MKIENNILTQQEMYSMADNLLFYRIPEKLTVQLPDQEEGKGNFRTEATCDLIVEFCFALSHGTHGTR